MRTALFALLALTTLALSGCTGGGDGGEGPSATSSGTASGSASSSATATAAPGNATPNRAPIPSLNASADGLTVNFTLDAQDADGDALAWTLAFGDDGTETGTSLPASLRHNYTAAGTYNVTLVVTDGDAAGDITLSLNVTAGTVLLDAIAIEGEITGVYVPEAGVYTAENPHPFTLLGRPAKMTVHLEWDDTGVDLDFELFAPDGTSAGAVANYNEPTGQAFDAREPDLVVEDAALLAQLGEWKVVVSAGAAVASAYTVDITFG